MVKLTHSITFILKLGLALTLGVAAPALHANVVNDPSFEGTTSNWTLVDSSTTFVNSPVRTGSQALRLLHNGDGVTPNTKTVWQLNAANVVPGQEYTYDVWVSGDNLTGTTSGGRPLAVVRWRDANGVTIKTFTGTVAQESFRFANFGTYGYTQDSMLMHLQAPARAFTADIGFRSWRETETGFSYWDDINLRERTINGRGDRLVSYEIEDASLLTGGDLLDDHIDFSGTGYYDVHTDGAIIEWNNVVSGTNRVVSVRFSWEGNPRDIELLVNGVSQGISTPVPTGRRGTWASHVFTGVNLPNASNTVRLVVNRTGGEKSQPMIDKIDIHAAGSETGVASEPQNVAASNQTFNDKVQVTWDPVVGATRYEIFRSLTPGSIGSFYAGSAGPTFNDTDTTELVTYYYMVKACNSEDTISGNPCSVLSTQVSGVRAVDITRLDGSIDPTDTANPIDLTTVGVSDWRHWGLTGNSSTNQKAGVVPIIPNYVALNGANPQQYLNSRAQYSWTDGTPSASNSTRTGVRMFDQDVGLELTLPADTNERTLILYLGVNGSSGTVRASLSDGSKPDFVGTIADANRRARMVTITYAAGSANQTLTVSYTKNDNVGSILWDAAAMIVPNQAPTWTPIGTQTVVENQQIVIPLVTTDTDGPTTTTLTETNTLPGNPNILTDNGDGTGSLTWTPSLGDAANSPYSVTVTATDSLGASSSQTFNIQVFTNSAPTIAPVTDKMVVEGSALSFAVSASDPDGPTPIVLSQTNNLPGSPNILFDNGDGTGTIAWGSSVGDAAGSPYQVTLTATDNANAASNLSFNIIVTASQPPIMSAIGDRSVIEQRNLTVNILASDPDTPGTLVFTQTNNLPGTPNILTDNADNTATLSYTPGVGDSGVYQATVTVTDTGGTSTSETFNITVTPNQIPALDNIADQIAVENQQIIVGLNAVDPDGPLPITLAFTENLPGTPTLIDNNDGTGELRYTPATGESSGGPYTVTITATDDDGATDSESFTVTVNANTAPTLDPIGDQTVREQVALTINLNATDSDGPAPLTLSQTNTLPGTPNNLINDNGDGTGTLTWTPSAGDYLNSPFTITINATDGEGLFATETITVEVLPQGIGGTLSGTGADIPNTTNLTVEGATDWVHMGRGGFPAAINRKAGVPQLIGAFDPIPGTTPAAGNNAIGDYSWSDGTPVGSDGSEKQGLRAFVEDRGYRFSVAAGLSPRTLKVYLGARNAVGHFFARLSDNSAPLYQNIITANSGKNGKVLTITFAAGLPGQTLDIEYFMSGPPTQSGGWIGLDAATLVSLNDAPTITPIADQNAVENQLLTVNVSAADPDGPAPLTLSASHNLPGSPSVFTDNGNGSGTVNWTPAVNDAGTYNISITATDGDNEQTIETFSVTVTANMPPVLDPISDTSAIEGQQLSVNVNATDPDGPAPLALTMSSTIPGNPNLLTDNNDGTGVINWTPAAGLTSGSPYTITVTATDGDGLTDTQMFSVTLTASAAPVLAPIGNFTVIENRPLLVNLSATDPDGPLSALTFSDTNDIGMSIVGGTGPGTAQLSWTPPVGAAANSPFTETVTVTDATGTSDSETIMITVVPNQAPVLTPIGPRNVVEGDVLFLTVTANDPDGVSPVSFTSTNTLPGTPNVLVDNNNNTATIIWTSMMGQAADPNNPYSITVTVTDADGATDVETFAVNVSTSEPPVLAPIGSQTAIEQLPLNLAFSATDSDSTPPLVYSLSHTLPSSPSFTDNGDGTASFSWTPAVGDAAGAPYSVTVTVTDSGGTATVETFTVNITPNASPVLAPIGTQTAVENATFTLNLSATDDGATPVVFTQSNNLPGTPNILTDNNDGTATISYMPGLDENLNSPFSVTVTVTDENGIQDSETFVLNVVRGGRLTGSGAAAPDNVDLTALGVDDWVHWGLSGNDSLNRKLGGTQQIMDWTPIADTNPQASTTAKSNYLWSDGDPTSNSINNANVRVFDDAKGVNVQLTASRSERVARIYVGASNATGVLTATLSDSSAPLFTTTVVAGAKLTREITLVYRTGSPGQTLDITWQKSGASGWISLDAITLENLNEAPQLAAIGTQNAVENQALTIALNASDPDGPMPIVFSQSNNLPGIPDILTDNGDGTGSLDWTPAVGDAAGSPYSVTLTVADGVGESATQTFSIVVAPNTPPTITAVADQALLENQPLTLTITASDSDGPAPLVLTQSNTLPSAPTFVDNNDGTASFSWTPGTGESSNTPYSVTITATDGDNFSSTETFLISVTASLPPVLAPVGDQTVIEGRLLSVPLSATDPDGPFPLTFTDTSNLVVNNNALSFMPAAGSAGSFQNTITVADGGGTADSETITITVLSDQAPVLTPVGTQTAFENAPFTLNFTAMDPDGVQAVVYSQSNNLPGNATFVDNGDNTATLTMMPVSGDSTGSPYGITVTVTDSFGNTDQEVITINVTPSQPPVIDPLADQTATEGEALVVNVNVTDTDGPAPLTITETNTLPGTPSILTDNGNGTATINYVPLPGDSFGGPYSVTVTATDGAGQSDTESFSVTVNREGMLMFSQIVNDGATVNLTSEGVSDWVHWGLGGNSAVNRKSTPTQLISNFTPTNGATPTSSTIMDASYTWNDGVPTTSEGGTNAGLRVFDAAKGFQLTLPADTSERTLKLYLGLRVTDGTVTASLSDGSVADTDIVLSQPSGKSSREVTLVYKAGSNNQTLTITYEKGTGGGWISLEAAAIVATNDDPSIVNIPDQTATEGNPLTIALNANDNGPAPITWSQSNNLPGTPDILNDFGNGLGELNWTPAVGDAAGSPYSVTVAAVDAAGASSTQTFSITVGINQDPVLVPIGAQNAVEQVPFSAAIVANDVDGPGFPALSFTVSPSIPLTLTDNGDGTGSLDWTPTAGASNNSPYTVTVTATDGVGNTDTTSFQLSITASFPPVLNSIGTLQVIENRALSVPVTATDADGNASLVLSEANSTVGQAILTDNGNGNGSLNWTPPIGASAGSPYTLDVIVTDAGGDTDVETVTIIVVPNQAPVLAGIGNQQATENVAFSLSFSASDADGLAPPMLTQTNNLPGSPSFVDNNDGTATLTFTPAAGDSANSPYTMTVTATDLDGATDVETFQISITASAPPQITPIGPQNAIENNLFSLTVTATDSDGPLPLTLTETNLLPGTLGFTDNGDGTADLSYTPAEGESLAGPYDVTITATDGSGVSATETFQITVNREGVINGMTETAPANTNLTTEGVADWTKWEALQIDRKVGVTEQISDWTGFNGLTNATRQANLNASFSWSDGTPAASGNNVATGAKTFTRDQGFQITLPAGLGTRQLRLYVSGRSTTGRITASLSDGSAANFVEDISHSGKQSNVVTISYKSSIPNQTLTVVWEKTGNGGWITLDAATLQEFNQAPTITPIADQTAVENQLLTFPIAATDLDGPSPLTLSASSTLPGNPGVFTDNGDGTGVFSYTPAVSDIAANPYTVTINAQDAAGAASSVTFNLTVVENQAPVLAPIGDQNFLVGQSLTLNLSATDDGPAPLAFSQTNTLPSAPTLIDNNDGTATFTWTAQAGDRAGSPYTVTVTVTDGDNKSSSEMFSISVTNSNPPVLANIANVSAIEGRTVMIPVSATDADGNNTITLSSSALTGLSLADNGDGTGVLTYTAPLGASTSSPYQVTVTATDSSGEVDAKMFTITVAANQAPVLAPIGTQSATENVQSVFTFSATDPDGVVAPSLTMPSNTLTGSPAFVDNGNGTASLTWTPGSGDSAGSPYSVTILTTDSEGATDTETFSVTVSSSNPPELAPIGTQDAVEGQLWTINVSATDADGPAPLTFSETNTLPGSPSILTDNNDGTATLSYTPAVGASNNSPYSVTVTVTDGAGASDEETFILNVNREGSITHTLNASPATVDLTVEGTADWIQWALNAVTDVNRKATGGNMISNWSPVNSPNLTRSTAGNADYNWTDGTPTSSEPGTSTGVRHFQVGRGLQFTAPAGVGLRQLNVYMTASGGAESRLTATLSDNSAAPLVVDITDGSKHSRVIAISYKSSTPNATLTVQLEKTAGSSKWVSLDAATLQEFNQAPTITPVGDQTAIENQLLTFPVSAMDADGPTPLTLSAVTTLPGDPAVLTDNGDGTGVFSYTPAVGDAAGGPYTVTLRASDGLGVQNTLTFNLTVLQNQSPVLAAIGDQNALVGQTLTLNLSATDDGPAPLAFSQTNTLPSAPTLTDNNDGSATFTWTPQAGDRAGSPYTVTVTVTDGDNKSATETFSVAVTNSNPPVLANIANVSAIEGRTVMIPVSATDADGNNTITLSNSALTGLSLADNGDGTGVLTYTAPLGASTNSPYQVTVTATDSSGEADAKMFTITVAANQAPVLAPIGTLTATENVQLTATFMASDADGINAPIFSQTNNLPGSPVVMDNGDGTATLTWTPGSGDSAGSPYSMTINVADGDGAPGTDSETFAITVSTSAAPQIAPISTQNAIEGLLWSLPISATDADGPAPLTFSETNTIDGSPNLLTDNGDGTGVLSYTPPVGSAIGSPYSVTLTATDGAGVSSDVTFTLNVNREGSIAATVTNSVANVDLTAEGTADWTKWAVSSGTSIDRKAGLAADLISHWTGIGGINAVVHGSTTARYSWTDGTPTTSATNDTQGAKTFTQGHGFQFTAAASIGTRELTVYLTGRNTTGRLTATLSDGSAVDVTESISFSGKESKTVVLSYKASQANQTLTVSWEKTAGGGWITLDAATLQIFNDAPGLGVIGNQVVIENRPLNLNISASDPDGPAPLTLSQSNTLPGTPNILTDNGGGNGVLAWTPAVGDAANSPYSVTVSATDGELAASSETFTVTVVANQDPQLAPIGTQSTTEIALTPLALTFNATDLDGPAPLAFSQTNTLPRAPTFVDNNDGTASFSFDPQAGDAANSPYSVTVTVTDGDNGTATETFTVNVSKSLPPQLTPIADVTVIEGRMLSVGLNATDADGPTPLVFSQTNGLPSAPALNDNGNGTGTFTWTAPVGAAANSPYTVTIVVTDDNGNGTSATDSFLVNVVPNQLPQIGNIPAQDVVETQQLSLNISASDLDGPAPLTLSLIQDQLPRGAVFNDLGNGNATLQWTSQEGDASATPYNLIIQAQDGQGGSSTLTVPVTVSASLAPTISPIADQNVVEGQTMTVSISATDPDGPAPIVLSQTNSLPGNAPSFVDNGDGTGTLTWTSQIGEATNSPYTVTITATDGVNKSSDLTFNVNVNREGAISGSHVLADNIVDLTETGSADWAKWGLRNAVDFEPQGRCHAADLQLHAAQRRYADAARHRHGYALRLPGRHAHRERSAEPFGAARQQQRPWLRVHGARRYHRAHAEGVPRHEVGERDHHGHAQRQQRRALHGYPEPGYRPGDP